MQTEKNTDCQWQAAYSVGNETLDNQHKTLLKICRTMGECVANQTKGGDSLFHEILNDLSVYSKVHFRTEESLLRLSEFPDTIAHIAGHDRYFEWLAELAFEALNGNIKKDDLQARVVSWWVNHICNSDMAYRPFLQKGPAA